jgi:hypothetical protein
MSLSHIGCFYPKIGRIIKPYLMKIKVRKGKSVWQLTNSISLTSQCGHWIFIENPFHLRSYCNCHSKQHK